MHQKAHVQHSSQAHRHLKLITRFVVLLQLWIFYDAFSKHKEFKNKKDSIYIFIKQRRCNR